MTHDRNYFSAETWALARADYLAGLTAPNVCRRYGMKSSTLRERARNEVWRRADQPDAPPAEDADDLDLSEFTAVEPIDALEQARLRAVAATLQGRAAEALRWSRVLGFWRTELDAETAGHEAEEARCRQVAADRRARGLPVRHEAVASADDPYVQNIDAALREGVDADERWLRLYGPVPGGPPYDIQALAAAHSAARRSAPASTGRRTAPPHSPHPDFSADPQPPPANRAERRRRARLDRPAPAP